MSDAQKVQAQAQEQVLEGGLLDQIVEEGRVGTDAAAKERGKSQIKEFVSQILQGHMTVSRDAEATINAHLDAMPVDERVRGLAGELLLLRGATSLAQRLAALGRVRAIKSRAAAPFLHAMTEAGEADLRSLAAVALAEIEDYTAKDALREALRAPQVSRRRAAVQAIGKSLSPDDVEALRVAVADGDVPVRTEAALALSHQR